jgi:Ribbon-helix-helix protein, copG family
VIRVKVRLLSGTWEGAAEAEGQTLAEAVRRAVGRRGLDLGVGKTIAKVRINTHEWSWDWSGHQLLVRESRSGPSGVSGRRKVLLSVSDDTLASLDALAESRHQSRSACVEALVLAASGRD